MLTRLTRQSLRSIKYSSTITRSFTKKTDDDDDLLFQEEDSTLPPQYRRDETTGKFTGQVIEEMTERDKKIIEATETELDDFLQDRLDQHHESHYEMGKRVRQQQISLNTIGRKVKDIRIQEDDKPLDGFSEKLSPREFKTLQEFLDNNNLTSDDIPVKEGPLLENDKYALKWLNRRGQDFDDDNVNVYSDLLPSDLSPQALVNRKRAKPIPRELLHHNNVGLLQTFLTPTGQIQSRIQTRLGARDQRKIAKLIKRARAMGLLPYIGQSKVENHGWKHAEDIRDEKPWEKVLKERGLVIQKK